MNDQMLLEAKERELEGRSSNKSLRRSGSIPAVIYGGKKDPVSISLMEKDITKASEISGFATQILKISISGNNEDVVVKELQRHPSTQKLLHADFLRVNPDSKITLTVPLKFLNEDICVGVKNQGGVISHILNDIEITCLASNLPESIEVDLAELELDDSILLSELVLSEGVEIPILSLGEDRDQTVVSVAEAKVIDIEPEIEEELEEGEEGEEGVEVTEEGEGEAKEGEETTKDKDSPEESSSKDKNKE